MPSHYRTPNYHFQIVQFSVGSKQGEALKSSPVVLLRFGVVDENVYSSSVKVNDLK